jgi:hypothetical protein
VPATSCDQPGVDICVLFLEIGCMFLTSGVSSEETSGCPPPTVTPGDRKGSSWTSS